MTSGLTAARAQPKRESFYEECYDRGAAGTHPVSSTVILIFTLHMMWNGVRHTRTPIGGLDGQAPEQAVR